MQKEECCAGSGAKHASGIDKGNMHNDLHTDAWNGAVRFGGSVTRPNGCGRV